MAAVLASIETVEVKEDIIASADIGNHKAIESSHAPTLLNLLTAGASMDIASIHQVLSMLSLLLDAVSAGRSPFYADNAWEIAIALQGYIRHWDTLPISDQTIESLQEVKPESKINSSSEIDSTLETVQLLLAQLASIGHPRDMFLFSCEYLHTLARDMSQELDPEERLSRFVQYYRFMLQVLERNQTPRKTSMVTDAIALFRYGLPLFSFLRSQNSLHETHLMRSFTSDFVLYFKLLVDYADTQSIKELLVASALELAETLFSYLDESLPSSILVDASQFLKTCRDLGIQITSNLECKLGHSIIVSMYFHPMLVGEQMPWILNRMWLFDTHLIHIIMLLESIQKIDHWKALSVLDFILVGFAEDSVTLSIYDGNASPNDTMTAHQRLIKAMIAAISNAPSQKTAQSLFVAFKRLFVIYTDEVKSRILLMLIMDSGAPAMIVAGITILKDCIHKAYNLIGNGKKTRPLFASRQITDTFFEALLDGKSILYRNNVIYPNTTIFENTELFFERHGIIMHALNLYLYLLLREKANTDRVGVWDSMHLCSVERKLLCPARLAMNRTIKELEADMNKQIEEGRSSSGHAETHAISQGSTGCDHSRITVDPNITNGLINMQILESVLDHIQECIREHTQETS
ncbi:hypothetical protein BASA81_008515 [Batrachochytrium salamandrivorans]|nr:hypothetical protein BASA81_008515 [Batrachochytrium salamandrivorans]